MTKKEIETYSGSTTPAKNLESMWTLKWTSKENCKATGAKKDEKFVVTMYAKCLPKATSSVQKISTSGGCGASFEYVS